MSQSNVPYANVLWAIMGLLRIQPQVQLVENKCNDLLAKFTLHYRTWCRISNLKQSVNKCQSHWMGHGQNPNLKMDMMMWINNQLEAMYFAELCVLPACYFHQRLKLQLIKPQYIQLSLSVHFWKFRWQVDDICWRSVSLQNLLSPMLLLYFGHIFKHLASILCVMGTTLFWCANWQRNIHQSHGFDLLWNCLDNIANVNNDNVIQNALFTPDRWFVLMIHIDMELTKLYYVNQWGCLMLSYTTGHEYRRQ